MGLAPKQKFAFVLDSHMVAGPGNPDPVGVIQNSWFTRALKALVLVLDPAIIFPINNKTVPASKRDRVWHLFGQ